jgi:glycosyltransferase involved in cell wall biosynthesis
MTIGDAQDQQPATAVCTAGPRISVIIPHYNDIAALDLCLSSVTRQTAPADSFEIVVADNMSPIGEDAVRAAIAGRARLVLATERGAGPARNAAVRESRGEILAFIDADCIAEPDWLAAGVRALDQHDVVGGHVFIHIGHDRPLSSAEAFEAVFAFDFKNYVERKGFTGAGNMFCRRSVFDATGPFRVGMSEDLEWSRRATAAGFTLGYAADARVGHPPRRNWAELRHKWLRIQAETFALKPPTLVNRLRFLARGWLMPLSIIAHASRIFTSSALQRDADRWAALRGLTRLRMWRFVDAHRLALGLRR